MRILVVPDSGTSTEVLRHLQSWSASGLLEPFCWKVAADEWLMVSLVEEGSVTQEALPDALEGVPHENVRIVAAVAATPEENFAGGFAEQVEQALFVFTDVLVPDPDHPVEASMVVLPQKIGQPVDPELFLPEWAACIYVAPEDRAAPDAHSRLPGVTGRFAAHAAHALATIADLWRGPSLRQSMLEPLLHVEAGEETAPVSVVRCYSRIVDFGYLADQLAAHVFRAGEAWPNPSPAEFDRVGDPGTRLEPVVASYLTKHSRVLGLSSPQKIPEPKTPELTILQAIKRLFNEILFQIRNRPRELIEQALIDGHNRIADILEGRRAKGSTWKIQRLGRSENNNMLTELRELRTSYADQIIRFPSGPVSETWADFRDFSLALIDGNDPPYEVNFEQLWDDGKRDIIQNPAHVVPDPVKRPPPPPAPAESFACDPMRLDPQFGPPVEYDEEGEPLPSVGTDGLDRAAWSEGHVDTPAWRIGLHIASNLRQALAEGQEPQRESPEELAAKAAADAAEKEVRRKQERRDRWKARGRFLLATALLIAGSVAVGIFAPWFAWLAAWPFMLLLYVGSLVQLGRDFIGRKEEAIAAELRAEIQHTNAALVRACRRGDAYRLEERYAEFLHWAEMTGWMAHHPWVGEPLTRVAVSAPVDAATLPAALGVATAQSSDQLKQLTRDARRALFRPRWLSGLYSSVEALALDEIRLVQGLAPNDPVEKPTADTTKDEDSPRRILLRRLREGAGRNLTESPLSRSLLAFVDGVGIDKAAETVAPVVAGGKETAALPPAVSMFRPPDDLPDLADRLRPTVVRIDVDRAGKGFGGSGVLVSPDGLIATARHVVRDASKIQVVFDDGSTSPAEIVHEADTKDLAVIRASGPSPSDFAAITETEDPLRQGDPVVNLGHPLLQEGEPTLAWGLVTATDRTITVKMVEGPLTLSVMQATYASAGGDSGSPVWNLDGRLVGIHTAGSGPLRQEDDSVPEYVSSAVPVEALAALLGEHGMRPAPEAMALGGNGAPGGRPASRPSAFLRGIATTPHDLSMLHKHWSDLAGQPDRVADVLHSAPASAGDESVNRLAGASAYLQPTRAAAHRIDVAGPSASSALTSCSSPDGPGAADS